MLEYTIATEYSEGDKLIAVLFIGAFDTLGVDDVVVLLLLV